MLDRGREENSPRLERAADQRTAYASLHSRIINHLSAEVIRSLSAPSAIDGCCPTFWTVSGSCHHAAVRDAGLDRWRDSRYLQGMLRR